MAQARQRNDLRERSAVVLDAARELFFAQGYRGTTIQQIAAAAGYSKRTVYLDYPSKDELFMSLCAEGGELLLSKLRDIPLEELSVEQAVDRVLEVFLRFSREHDHYFRMIFSESTAEIIEGCSPELRARVAQLERECLAVVVACTERGMREQVLVPIDPWEAAGIFVGTATGIVLLSMGGSQTVFSRERLETLAKNAIRTFFNGLRKPAAGS